MVSLIRPGDRVLVPVFGRFGHLLRRDRRARAGRGAHDRGAVGAGVHPLGDRRGDRAGASPHLLGDRAGRHLDHDAAAARRARRDLREARRAVLHRRHRVARRQPVRGGRLGPGRRHRRPAEVPGRPVGLGADHAVRRARSRSSASRKQASRPASARRATRMRRDFDPLQLLRPRHDPRLLGPAAAQPPHRGDHDALRRARVRPRAAARGARRTSIDAAPAARRARCSPACRAWG